MNITEVSIKLAKEHSKSRLLASASIVIDGIFLIKKFKVVQGFDSVILCMPNEKVERSCDECRSKNHLRAKFCNECGTQLPDQSFTRRDCYLDVAHPICSEGRTLLETVILTAYFAQVEGRDIVTESDPIPTPEFGEGLDIGEDRHHE